MTKRQSATIQLLSDPTYCCFIDDFFQHIQLDFCEDLIILWNQFGTPLKKLLKLLF